MNILFVILMAFGWAIGGEKHFGKWRRGALLSIPLFMFCYTHHLSPVHYLASTIYCWGAYQLLFYDDGIKAMFPYKNIWSSLWGITILLINGAIIGALPVAFMGSMLPALINAGSMVVFSYMANIGGGIKLPLDGIDKTDVRILDVKIWCPADSWWLSEFCIGAVLGISFLVGL